MSADLMSADLMPADLMSDVHGDKYAALMVLIFCLAV